MAASVIASSALRTEYFLKYVPVFLEMKEMGRAGGVDGFINIIQIQIH